MKIPENRFTLASLAEACPDGLADFERQLLRAVDDCIDHRTGDKARTVKLEFRVYPHPSDERDVIVEVGCGSKIPGRKHPSFRLMKTRSNQLMFKFLDDSADAA